MEQKKHKKRLGFTTKYTVIFCALLLAINSVLAFITMSQAGESMKEQIRKHMLAVSNTAAAMVNGEAIKTFNSRSVGTVEYVRVTDALNMVKNAQRDSDIKYIYITKKLGDRFVFVCDPDPVDPAYYGEEVVYTEAQDVAWRGTPAVDAEPMEDEWGFFYSSWSPIRDLSGEVVGLVGVDFSAEWYNQQVARHTRLVIIIIAVSLVAGAAVVVVLISKLRAKFRVLNNELTVLAGDLGELFAEIEDAPDDAPDAAQAAPEDELVDVGRDDMIMTLSARIREMQVKLKNYIAYIHEQAYTDTMTNVSNKTAYLDHVKELNREIAQGTADFALAIFDINGLKVTNDTLGHEAGDLIITATAERISAAFPNEHVFRIGGDEFVAITGHLTEEELRERFAAIDAAIEGFNRCEKEFPVELSLSHGCAVYTPGEDSRFKDVFRRADRTMYDNKADYYRRTGGTSHNSGLDGDIPI